MEIGMAMKKMAILLFAVTTVNCANMYAAMHNIDAFPVYKTPPSYRYDVLNTFFKQDEYIEDAIRDLKIKAKKIGADGLLIIKIKEPYAQKNSQNEGQTIIMNQNTYSEDSDGYFLVEAQAIRLAYHK
jgi:hypothetical protein